MYFDCFVCYLRSGGDPDREVWCGVHIVWVAPWIREVSKGLIVEVVKKLHCRGRVKHSTLLPFSDRLRHAKMPRGFRMPKFKTFSGIGDPSSHLNSFDSQLSFWASDDEVYARAFPSSLSGQALKWFRKLPPNSIDCWQDAVDLFMDKFGALIVTDADERTLMEIQSFDRHRC
ncbi:hypothetical protein LIER_06480 [Lithospermum erythrorhizon]|uniref:Retrotransposon gag domain-containing protein n=1 Tax=Lithospermum erythrorhizon TaxID=34254 RepID=A0AAV3P4Z4_LITER